VRAVGLHADVIVTTSRAYATSCTLVRSPSASRSGTGGGRASEAFCIDSPVFPDELEILPVMAERAGFGVAGLLATHADWDHLLGRYGFPEAPLGAAETSAARLTAEPGAAQRELRAFDEDHYVERPGPLSLPGVQALPVPGHVGVGEAELELHPADGHTADGMAVWIPWAGVLVAGDYLSPVEIPMLSPGGSASAYLATLARLEPLVAQAEHVVPGHGGPIEGARAAAILREDRAYLEALLERGAEAKLPLARRSAAQKRIHAANVAMASGAVTSPKGEAG
jgi:glyoxylase-like metal-dependent hydrolase (beta-lactamase superfamily II)